MGRIFIGLESTNERESVGDFSQRIDSCRFVEGINFLRGRKIKWLKGGRLRGGGVEEVCGKDLISTQELTRSFPQTSSTPPPLHSVKGELRHRM